MKFQESPHWETFEKFARVFEDAKAITGSLRGCVAEAESLPATGAFPGAAVAESAREAMQKMSVVSGLVDQAMDSLATLIKVDEEDRMLHGH
ncbi:hypothetical protein GCM10027271_18460 [Saccharopolyspora gloriosae]|uniref:Uncharacterized protein n=1 Tax=Saccharopolyspora gloriosae TaxID=455344 RepID=A0A840N5U8_9PSEU|nr:hypothetical protein [Saccharopolyspora gloriosae]MBB5067396.1 hypothetical protein [Saccharopolyspora gloriosae]